MMIGGGASCGGSDYGIGITEKNGSASFYKMEHKLDFRMMPILLIMDKGW